MSAESRIELELAVPADDEALRRIMRETPMPGAIQVAFHREPSFFAALKAEGFRSDVIVGRDRATGELGGLGTRSIRRAYVNGLPSEIGYLSSLRILPAYRRGMHLARSYRFLRHRHEFDPVPMYLSTIVEENRLAQRLLTSGRCGLPAYHDMGRVWCATLRPSTRSEVASNRSIHVRPAEPADVPAVQTWIETEGAARQFFPCLSASAPGGATGLMPGLSLSDIRLAWRDDKMAGMAAIWDQSSLRQIVVTGYAAWIGRLRWLINRWADWRDLPQFPAPGTRVGCLYLSLVCVAQSDPAVFAALLDEALRIARRRGVLLVTCLHESDPLLKELLRRRHTSYCSRLYGVCWKDGESFFRSLDKRVSHIEIGSL